MKTNTKLTLFLAVGAVLALVAVSTVSAGEDKAVQTEDVVEVSGQESTQEPCATDQQSFITKRRILGLLVASFIAHECYTDGRASYAAFQKLSDERKDQLRAFYADAAAYYQDTCEFAGESSEEFSIAAENMMRQIVDHFAMRARVLAERARQLRLQCIERTPEAVQQFYTWLGGVTGYFGFAPQVVGPAQAEPEEIG